MTQVLLTILIVINILMIVGMGIFGYVIYKKFLKPIMSKTGITSNLSDINKAFDMLKDFKIPNQWKK